MIRNAVSMKKDTNESVRLRLKSVTRYNTKYDTVAGRLLTALATQRRMRRRADIETEPTTC